MKHKQGEKMKLFIVAVSVVAVVLAMQITSHAAVEVTPQNIKQTFGNPANGKEEVVITFYSSECGPCHDMMPKLDAAEKKYPKVKFYRFNVDNDLSVAEQIAAVPTTIMIKKGTVVGGMRGDPPTQEVLNNALEKAFNTK